MANPIPIDVEEEDKRLENKDIDDKKKKMRRKPRAVAICERQSDSLEGGEARLSQYVRKIVKNCRKRRRRRKLRWRGRRPMGPSQGTR